MAHCTDGAEQTAALLADLDSDDFAVREKASAELEKLGEFAGAFQRARPWRKPSTEVRRRVGLLAEVAEGVARAGNACELRWSALEQVGGTEVRQLLRRLAEGLPAARLTQERTAFWSD
jgi:hypothetical protein